MLFAIETLTIIKTELITETVIKVYLKYAESIDVVEKMPLNEIINKCKLAHMETDVVKYQKLHAEKIIGICETKIELW